MDASLLWIVIAVRLRAGQVLDRAAIERRRPAWHHELDPGRADNLPPIAPPILFHWLETWRAAISALFARRACVPARSGWARALCELSLVAVEKEAVKRVFLKPW